MLKATVYMLNGDVYELPHGDELFKFLVIPTEHTDKLPRDTPVYTSDTGEKRLFTFKFDEFFLTLNRDAISHIEWGDAVHKFPGARKTHVLSRVEGVN